MKNDQSDFGAPKVDNTPTGRVTMYGQLFRGISDNRNKPMWVRVASIAFCLICLMIPGLFLLFASFVGYQEGGIINTLPALVIGFVLIFTGFGGIKANSKKNIAN